ncbi:MAG: hypothetical protein ACOCRK_02570 [bacterium]
MIKGLIWTTIKAILFVAGIGNIIQKNWLFAILILTGYFVLDTTNTYNLIGNQINNKKG